jgi:hypothetical protein
MLVEASQSERPDIVLIKSVVNSCNVVVRRVGVDTLTLKVVEYELLIVVFNWNHRGSSYCGAFLGLEVLESLPVVVLHESHIIEVLETVRVLLKFLIESDKRVVKNMARKVSMSQLFRSNLESLVDWPVVVLHLVFIDACLVVGCS